MIFSNRLCKGALRISITHVCNRCKRSFSARIEAFQEVVITPRNFAEKTYLGQVRHLRNLALNAIKLFPIDLEKLHFINHGENTTFKVTAACGSRFLLRIHRANYHSPQAIGEELQWLKLLQNKGFAVPEPVCSHIGELLTEVEYRGLNRQCSLLKWVEGRFVEKSISPGHLFQAGKLLAGFQNATPGSFSQHRIYWNAEGMAGEQAMFGCYDKLEGIDPADQELISQARRAIFARLKAYQESFPEKMGLIHADLHFGNILNQNGSLAAIDFDDCGFGFHVYDLVIPYIGALARMNEDKKKRSDEFFAALIAGYQTSRAFTDQDESLFHCLLACRKILMLGWLNSRSDNPCLRELLPGWTAKAVEHIKNNAHHFM